MEWTKREQTIIKSIAKRYKNKDKYKMVIYKEMTHALKNEGYKRNINSIKGFLMRNKLLDYSKKAIRKIEAPNSNDTCRFTEALEKLKELRFKMTGYNKIGSERKKEIDATVKILSLSDMHCPFENTDVISHALENHGDADTLVLNGDLLEMYSVSTFPSDKLVLLRWEYEIALEWIKLFSDIFPKVVLVSGNHENRLKRYFSNHINPVASFLADNDMLVKLSQGYDFDENDLLVKKYNFNNVYYKGGLLSWYTKIGKCLFAHPSNFSKIPMRTALTAANYFLDRNDDFQCFIMGHTHKIGNVVWRDRLIIEQGCCCMPLSYEANGKANYTPQTYGYAVVYMDDQGNIDFNNTRPVYIGSGTAIEVKELL